MKGGFWENLTNAWAKTKETASNAYGSITAAPTTQTSSYAPSSTYGGKKKRMSRRKMRGGNYSDNTSLNNLAANAAPFAGKTAQPNTWVGGKTRRHTTRKRGNKNRRSHKRR